ncbi:MAG TPA: SusC/RagA family TonB-linked outer membrane protein [Balneolaceae bacterium]
MGLIKRTLLAICFLLLNLTVAFSQGSLSGKVTDQATGVSMPGTNVYIQNLNRGASTDADGNYTIQNIPLGTYTVTASFIGYKKFTQEVVITEEGTVLNIELVPQAIGLEDVVVTALGIKREERSIGYAVEEVDGAVIERSQETSIINSLAGMTSGVQITSSSGAPGASSRIIIRGNSSLTGNNQPLFVVDGVPISNGGGGGDLFEGASPSRGVDLDPNIIESVSVLKGASATALYGSRAANGAIIITTKGGDIGKRPLQVNVSSSVSFSKAILDGYQDEYLMGSQGFYSNGLPFSRGGYVAPGYPGGDPQTFFSWGPHKNEVSQQVLNDLGVDKIQTYNPRKQFFDMGLKLDNNISLSGGSSQAAYFFSVSGLNHKGIVPGSELERTSIFAKFNQKLSDRLSANTSVNYISTNNVSFPTGNTHRSYTQNLQNTAISFDITDYRYEDGTQRYQTDEGNNPLWLINNSRYLSDVWRVIGNTTFNYEITPWLSLSERLGVDAFSQKNRQEWNVNVVERPAGRVVDSRQSRTEINSDLTLNIDKQINENISVTGLIGNNINSRTTNFVGFTASGLSVPGFYDVSNATQVVGGYNIVRRRLVSLYGQFTLDYDDYLYLTLTGRNDWSSTLPKDNNSYFYPSASVGFIFTELLDMGASSSFLNYGKLRLSVAQIGNDAPPYSIRANLVQSSPSDGTRGIINYPFNGVNGYEEGSSLGNLNLRPEITTEYEAGIELRLLKSRLNLDVTYYNRTSRDQIYTVSISNATGYGGRLANAGSIRNQGWEISLNGSPVQTANFSWDIQLNYTRNRTTVLELAEGVESIYLGGYTAPNIRALPGEDGYGIIWGQKYEHNEKGQILVDDNGYPVYEGRVGRIGNVTPDFTANLRNTFHYKGLALSVLFDTKQGNDILNFNYWDMALNGTHEITENRGTTFVFPGVNVNTGEPNTVEIVRDQDYYINHWWPVYENYVEDGSYIKLRQVSLSYTLPNKLFANTPLKGITIGATGRNLLIFTDFTMGDPEGNILGDSNAQGFYHELTPSTRSLTFSINVSL